MTRLALSALVVLSLAACKTPGSIVATPLDPLPTAICAPIEPEPQGPALTPDQLTTADAAVIVALGEALGIPYIRWLAVEHPAWGRRQADRVQAGAAECARRNETASR